MNVPKLKLLIDYKQVYNEEPPQDRLSLIRSFSKQHILYEIVGLNYRLKPKLSLYTDMSLETQKRELEYFAPNNQVYKLYTDTAQRFTSGPKDFPFFFNRQACLFAIEEITNDKSMESISDFKMLDNIEVWEGILKYLLAVNYTITQMKEDKSRGKEGFEFLNSALLPLNELGIESDPIYTPFRGLHFHQYLLKDKEYKDELNKYIESRYNQTPRQFIYNIMSLYLTNKQPKAEFEFYYKIAANNSKFYSAMSDRVKNSELHKLISIRKSPMIEVGANEYILSDNMFLLEKSYNQFLNDFWFDWLKGKGFSIKDYRSTFGHFFETYCNQIFKHIFKGYKYSVLLTFDNLKLNLKIGAVEIADIYLRNSNRILLGEVKSGNIYDDEKFGGDTETLYRNNRNLFFKNFGVDQLIDSIIRMDEHIEELDPKFPKGHAYKVHPCIIVNDKALQTPLMADTFNKRFQELKSKIKLNKVIVYPLALIHISDLERIQFIIDKNPSEIWNLLKHNAKNHKFIPPFYDTINALSINREYPEEIMGIFRELIDEFGLGSTD